MMSLHCHLTLVQQGFLCCRLFFLPVLDIKIDTHHVHLFLRVVEPILAKIEPVGPSFLAHARRQLFNRTFSEDEEHLAKVAAEAAAAEKAAQLDDDSGDMDFEIEADYRGDLKRDAKDWKTQDHYRMLGLGSIRWRATRGMIKKARTCFISLPSKSVLALFARWPFDKRVQ